MISSILKKSLQQETKQSKIDSGNDISVCATKDAVALVAKRGAATVIFERQIDGVAGLSAALADLALQANVRGRPASLILGADFYDLLLTDEPNLPSHEIEDAVRWQISDRVSGNPEKSIIRCFNAKSLISERQHAKLYAAVVDDTFLEVFGMAFLGAGIRLKSIQIAELAVARYLHTISVDPLSAAVVCGQETGMTVIQHKNDFLFSRRFVFNSSSSRFEQIQQSIAGAQRYLQNQFGGNYLETWLLLDDGHKGTDQEFIDIRKQLSSIANLKMSGTPLSLEAVVGMGAQISTDWPSLASSIPERFAA